MGRMARSTTLLSISIRPSSRQRVIVRPGRERVADRLGEFRFAGDSGELGLQPGLHRLEDRSGADLGGRPAAPKLRAPGYRVRWRRGRRSSPAPRRRSGPGSGGLDVEEVSPRVRPAESQRNRVALGQRREAVAIDPEASSEAGQMRGGTLVLAVGLVDIGDARRLGTAPGPVVAGIGPVALVGLGLASARIEHRRARLVGEELGRNPSRRRTLARRRAVARRRRAPTSRPASSGAEVDVRKAKGMQQAPIGPQTAMTTAAISASVGMPPSIRCSVAGACFTWTSHSRHAYLGRRATMTLKRAGIMSSRSETSSPSLTRSLLQQGQHLSARSTTTSSRGKWVSNAPRLIWRLRRTGVLGWLALAFRLGLRGGDRLPDVLQHQSELVRSDLLRSRAEAMTLKHLDDGDQTLVLVARGDEQFLERPCIVGKRIRRRRHDLTGIEAPIVGVTWKI